ncbi:MAG: nucleoside deaminase [Candidatus Omnitrophota bacterium]
MYKPVKKHMKLAIKEAEKNLKTMRGGPFGACIVKGNKVLSVARNKVIKKDATCHAEIEAIREASKKLGTFDLSGCIIYSTAEPCPMCFSAIHWARIDTIVYGATIKDAVKIGFNELNISNRDMKKLGRSKVRVVSGFMKSGCRDLMNSWNNLEKKVFY